MVENRDIRRIKTKSYIVKIYKENQNNVILFLLFIYKGIVERVTFSGFKKAR